MYGRISDPWIGMHSARGSPALKYEPQSIRDRSVGLMYVHLAGRFRAAYRRFRPEAVGVVQVCDDF